MRNCKIREPGKPTKSLKPWSILHLKLSPLEFAAIIRLFQFTSYRFETPAETCFKTCSSSELNSFSLQITTKSWMQKETRERERERWRNSLLNEAGWRWLILKDRGLPACTGVVGPLVSQTEWQGMGRACCGSRTKLKLGDRLIY